MAKLNMAALTARLEELNKPKGAGGGTTGDRLSWVSIKDGLNTIRILPPKDGADSFAEELWVHYGVGKSGDSKGTMVVCPKTHDENAACPVCELSAQLRKLSKKKDDANSKAARDIGRKKRVYYNAIDRSDDLDNFEQREEDGKKVWYNKETDEQETPIKVLGTGIGVFKDLLSYICDPEYGDITDAEEGLDVKITKSGSGQFATNYEVKTARKESPIGFDGWESHLNDLKTLTKAKTYDELVALLNGEVPKSSGSKADDEEDDGKPVDISDDPRPSKKDKGSDDEADKGDEEEDDDIQADIKAALARRKK